MNKAGHNRRNRSNLVRKENGFSTVALILVIVFFAVLPAALFAFEAARASLVQIELQNITDASALGGTAYLAGSADLIQNTITDNQIATMNAAYQFFAYNALMDTALVFTPGSNTQLWGSTSSAPGSINAQSYPAVFSGPPSLHTAQLTYTLLDISNNPQPLGSSTAVSLEVSSSWTESTIFAGFFLPILSTYTVSAVAFGGLPQLDLVLCFDVSGSMDDGTNVCLVNRYYDPNNGNPQITYAVVPGSGATQITSFTSGCNPLQGDSLFNLLNLNNQPPSPTGTPVNVGQPQQLSLAAYAGTGTVFNFQSGLRAANGSNGVTSPGIALGSITAEASVPPGNYNPLLITKAYYPSVTVDNLPPSATAVPNPSASGNPSTNDFTDLVMLLPPVQIPSGSLYNFGSGNTAQQVMNCVEASRGNLETAGVFSAATCGLHKFNVIGATGGGSAATPTAAAGSYAAYWYGVRQLAYPMCTALAAASNFFQTMNLSTNAHFSLVTFAGTIDSANGATGHWTGDGTANSPPGSTANNVDWNFPGYGTNYTFGGQYGVPATTNALNGFPLPCLTLSSSANNLTQSLQLLTGNASGTIDPTNSSLVALGGTDMGDAITEAFNILTGPNARPTASKAIVLFSDGIPTEGPAPVSTAQTLYAAHPIPCYTIGLSITQSTTFNSTQGTVLGDGVTPNAIGQTSGNGVAAVTGAHAYFVPANNPPVTTEQNLNSAFEQIAKSLVVLQQQ